MPPVEDRNDRERLRAIEAAVGQIEKQFGKGSIMRLGGKDAVTVIPAISTGAIMLLAPSRMIEPLPNCFSIWPTAASSAFIRSCRSRASSVGGMCLGPFGTRLILETRQAKVKRKSV